VHYKLYQSRFLLRNSSAPIEERHLSAQEVAARKVAVGGSVDGVLKAARERGGDGPPAHLSSGSQLLASIFDCCRCGNLRSAERRTKSSLIVGKP
jgi:hypothetical protein